MKMYKVEVELELRDDADPDFLFPAINELLEDGEKMTVARWISVPVADTTPPVV